MGQPIAQLEEFDLFSFLRVETAFDQIDDVAVGADSSALRESLNTTCNR